jgi:uncharacterized UBP type Zn finger protein
MEDGKAVSYELKTIIVHRGRGIQNGHYLALIRVCGVWILADDDALGPIDQQRMQSMIGSTPNAKEGFCVPYILFYDRIDDTE